MNSMVGVLVVCAVLVAFGPVFGLFVLFVLAGCWALYVVSTWVDAGLDKLIERQEPKKAAVYAAATPPPPRPQCSLLPPPTPSLRRGGPDMNGPESARSIQEPHTDTWQLPVIARRPLRHLDQDVKSGSLDMHMSVTDKRTNVARRINSLGMRTDRPVSRLNSLGVIIPDQERHLP